jgi:two-component sensor histidine kinase
MAHRVKIQGPAIELSHQFAHAIIMIVHELGTNSIKYGSLSLSDGRLEVQWLNEIRGTQHFVVIRWKESGGPLVKKPKKIGFGTKMIEAAAHSLSGGEVNVHFDPAGVNCTIVLPTAPAH